MKILLINDYGTATWGAELQILSLRENLKKYGHDARLFSSNAQLVKQSPVLSDYSCFGCNSRFQVFSQTINLSCYWKLKKVLRDFKPDIIHVCMFLWQLSPLILPLIKPFPSLYQVVVYKAICPIGTKILPNGHRCNYTPGKVCLTQNCLTPQSWTVLMLQRQLWKRWKHDFNLVVALNHQMKMQLEQESLSPVKVVYNGVEKREIRPVLTNPPIVVFAGRLSSEKGVKILLAAFSQLVATLPTAQLLIAGQGDEEDRLHQLAQKLGLLENVTWLGYLTRQDLENKFNCAWVQVVPSLWDEPFGNVTIEAMMRGTAVIASAVGAQPEIIDEGITGFLVPPKDASALAKALLLLLGNKALAEQIGLAARQKALTDFSEDKYTTNFIKIYEDILSDYNHHR